MNRNHCRSLISLFLSLVILVGPCISASAVSENIQPHYLNISYFKASLSISDSGYSTCNCSVTAYDPSLSMEVTMELLQYKKGDWESIAKWNTTGKRKVTLDKGRYVVSGYLYQVSATVTVKDSSGTILEEPTAVSDTVRY